VTSRVLVLAVIAACNRGSSTAGAGSARPVPVKTVAAARDDVQVWRLGLGSVAAFQQVTVRTQVDGRLDAVKFIEGQAVKAGDVLAQIDPRPFDAQLLQAQGALRRDASQLDVARRQLERYTKLRAENLVADATVETYEAQVGQLEGAVKIDQAQIDTARLNLDYARIKAPLAGVTGVRLVDAGNIVHAADATGLVVITAIDPAAVFFTLPQDYLGEIVAAQQRGAVPVEIWNRDMTKQLGKDGRLAVLDNQINQTTATLRLKAFVDNGERTLWPNAFVKARILVDTRKNALVVPVLAVQQGPNGQFVYVVDNDGVAQMRTIKLELSTDTVAVLADSDKPNEGVRPGEQVVIEGQNQLRQGVKVTTGEHKGSGEPKGSGAPKGRGSAASAGPTASTVP